MHADLQIPFEKGKTVSCAVNSPAGKSSNIGIILAHGAGGDMHSGNLPKFAEAFAGAGFVCLRFTCKPTQLAYRVRACQAVIDGAASSNHEPLESVTHWIFAGHSMGARVASAMAAASPDRALACILFSYPLHTPGNQDSLRDVPLVDLTLPIMFVHGSKDTMCEAGIFQAVRGRMSSSDLQVHEVADGDHGLKIHAGKNSKSLTEAALQKVSSAMCDFANGIEAPLVSKAGDKVESSRRQLPSKTKPGKPEVGNKRIAPATNQTRSKKAKP
ncbi:hypothetical protein ABBQ32_005896 [Trebouxia sp. C0010 RCD-2024]